MGLNLLVVEGNTSADRAIYREGFGLTASESYARTLSELAPDARCDIVCPADAGANLPGAAALADYDGVFITGSALNLYDGGPEIARQIELARAVFTAKVPFFGSCWGLQVATAAAGGEVVKNPVGREIGLARNIAPTEAGRGHPLLAGRPGAFDALCSHLDIVGRLPEGAVALAQNAFSAVQAAEIPFEGGRFWGVQYHPEYGFAEVAAIIERRAGALTSEGFFADEGAARACVAELRALEAAPERRDIAWRLGISDETLDPARRRRELIRFLDDWARPAKSSRGRA